MADACFVHVRHTDTCMNTGTFMSTHTYTRKQERTEVWRYGTRKQERTEVWRYGTLLTHVSKRGQRCGGMEQRTEVWRYGTEGRVLQR